MKNIKRVLSSLKECVYCGRIPYKNRYAYHRTRYSRGTDTDEAIKFHGLDRIIPNKGYTEENCVPCCIYCNRAKSDLSISEFKKHIKRLYRRLIKCES